MDTVVYIGMILANVFYSSKICNVLRPATKSEY